MIEDDVEFALEWAIDKLKDCYPYFDSDPAIDVILDIYNANFE